MDEFYCRTKIISGAGALAWLEKLHCTSLLVVTDPYFMNNGWAEDIARRVKAQSRTFFDRVRPDPTVELAAEGTALMRQTQPDVLIALGGGSAMDTAKAMRHFSAGQVKLIAIPTTSGSGSEVTDFAILTHGAVKYPLVDKCLQPDVAILAEELVAELPPALVADGGFDVLSHALESYVATTATPISKALAADAFCEMFSHLAASFSGQRALRGKLHTVSCMAGIAFSQSGLGVCHALSHSLGGLFHIPHGRLNAILLPEVVSCNASVAAAEYAKLARLAGMGGSADAMAVRNLRNGLLRLRRELSLPQTLQQAGVAPAALRQYRQEILRSAMEDPCMKTNPLQGGKELLCRILEAVSGG